MDLSEWGQRTATDHGAYWVNGDGGNGYNETCIAGINADPIPVLRIAQRSALMETAGRAAVNARGERVQCDEAGKRVMREKGTKETWIARRFMAKLHAHHCFTHGAYTDASKTNSA